jgi:hypothetical protein
MSELSGVELGPLFSPEEREIINFQRFLVNLNNPDLEVSDVRLLEAYQISRRAAEVGCNATIESRF